jgi:hypothetical protein
VRCALHKERGGHVAELDGYLPGTHAGRCAGDAPVDLLLDASPVNLQTGEPGLAARCALH